MAKKIEQFLNKIIYIPLEIIDREIDGALLLSFEAISRGWSVIIGSQRRITENIWPIIKTYSLLLTKLEP